MRLRLEYEISSLSDLLIRSHLFLVKRCVDHVRGWADVELWERRRLMMTSPSLPLTVSSSTFISTSPTAVDWVPSKLHWICFDAFLSQIYQFISQYYIYNKIFILNNKKNWLNKNKMFHRIHFEILSFQMVYNLWWLLKHVIGEKARK